MLIFSTFENGHTYLVNPFSTLIYLAGVIFVMKWLTKFNKKLY